MTTDEIPSKTTHPRRSSSLDGQLWLFGILGLLVTAAILEARADGLVGVFGSAGLPETCMLKRNFCMLCPGCGLTRSFIHMADGELVAAWTVNWVGAIAFVYTLAQIPIAVGYLLGVQDHWMRTVYWLNTRALISLALLLIVRWAYLLFTGNLYAHG